MTPPTPRSRRAGRYLAGATFCIFLLTAGGGLGSSDAVLTFEVTKSLVEHGSVASANDVKQLPQLRGIDGRIYAPFGIGQSVFNIPFYVVGTWLRIPLGASLAHSDTVPKAAVALGSVVSSTGLVWVAFLFAWRLGGNLAAASRSAMALAFGTLVWSYSKFGFNAPLAAWSLLAGAYATWLGVQLGERRRMVWGGTWLACAFLTRHEMAIPAAMIAIWILVSLRDNPRLAADRLLSFGAPLATAAAFWLWFNAVRFGAPLNTGYVDDPTIGFSLTTLEGLTGLLLSPGRSLFVYAPITLAGVVALVRLVRHDRGTAALLAAVPLCLLAFYGTMSSWAGDRSYGPRYLVPALAFLTLPLACWPLRSDRMANRLVIALLAMSVAIQLPGVLMDFSKVSVAFARSGGGNNWESRIYTWRESGLVLNAHAALRALPANAGYLATGTRPLLPPAHDGEDSGRRTADRTGEGLGERLQFSLDFWWLYLYYLGILSAPVALGTAGACLVAAGIMLGRLHRLIRADERAELAGAAT